MQIVRTIILCSLVLFLVSSCGGGSESDDPPSQAEPLAQSLAKKPGNCVPNKSCFSLGGTISGLTSSGLTLVNGADVVSPAANATTFTFPTYLARKVTYLVTVSAQPAGLQCIVANGTGTMDNVAVTNVAVTCVNNNEATVSTLAGSGAQGSADGTGSTASFAFPRGIAVDSAGNVYVGDHLNTKIRKVTPAGDVTTLAGSGTLGSDDGTGSAASFYHPSGVAVDSAGNVYVADTYNNKIRKITPAGEVTTLAGSGAVGSDDGTGSAATFDRPFGVALDSAGNVYVGDTYNNKIRKITPAGEVTTLAGSGAYGGNDGAGSVANFANPYGVAVDSAGNVYVADFGNSKIRKITPAGDVSTLAGSFNRPNGVAVDIAGNVYVADLFNHMIRKITPAGEVTTLAGSGAPGSADGIGSTATFYFPYDVALDSAGNVYVADGSNHKIRKITPPNQ